MHDIKKAYYDDLNEKSALARSARAGTRKSKCWKTYTKKELELMNGPTYRVNPNEFISYVEFKALPDTLKKEYCQTVIDNWNIGPNALAKMWGITGGTVCPILKRLGVKTNGKRSSTENTERFFADFVNGTASVSPVVQTKKNDLLQRLDQLFRYLRRAEYHSAA